MHKKLSDMKTLMARMRQRPEAVHQKNTALTTAATLSRGQSTSDGHSQEGIGQQQHGDYQIDNGAANCPLLSRLPLELHVMIVDNLLLVCGGHDDGNDNAADSYLTALQTCRAWRYLWLSDEIWPALAELWIPGFVEMIRLSPAQPGEAEQFRRLLQAARRRQTGRFTTALHHGMRLGRHDRLFRISTAVPAEEGGVHEAFDDEDPEPDSAEDSDSGDETDGSQVNSNSKVALRLEDTGQPRQPTKPPKPTYFRFMMYNTGRLAWWPHAYARPYSAVVDDLRTGERRMYDFPAHAGEQVGYTAAMSSALLLMGRGRVLHAWHLGADRLQTAVFPLTIERVFAEGDRLLAVAQSTTDVFFWHHGMEWIAVDMSPQLLGACYMTGGMVRASGLVELPPVSPPHRVGLRLCESGMLLDFILHPIVAETFFVVTFSTDHELRVHEVDLSHGGNPEQEVGRRGRIVAVHKPEGQDMSVFRDLPDHHGYLHWEKIDSHGGYCLMMVNGGGASWAWHRDGGSNRGEGNNAATTTPCAQPDSPRTMVAVCFNIYTRQFDFAVYHPPWQLAGSWHLWNGLLYAPDGMTGRDFVVASRRCSSGGSHAAIPYHDLGAGGRASRDGGTVASRQQPRDITCYTTSTLKSATVVGETPGRRPHDTEPSSVTAQTVSRRSRFAMTEADMAHAIHLGSDSVLLYGVPAAAAAGSAAALVDHILDPYQKQSRLPCKSSLRALARSPDGRQTAHYQSGRQRVLGDEGMLVFVDDQDYVVWGFGEEGFILRPGLGGDGGVGVGGKSSGLSWRMLPWMRRKKG
ncbi:hypothetical protein MN608_03009 [Microdochium nivale]|nr:hypothetical protein MN608_03009 [Microdochium nivale]